MTNYDAFKIFTYEFDNIVSSYPPLTEVQSSSEENRLDARIELVEYILTACIIGTQKLRSISSQSLKICARFDLLANWVLLRGSSHDSSCWRPTWPTEPINFVPSDFVLQCDVDQIDDIDIIPDCQNAMHQRLAVHDLNEESVPTSIAMIALLFCHTHPCMSKTLNFTAMSWSHRVELLPLKFSLS